MKISTLKILCIQLILILFMFLNYFVFDIFSIKEYAYFVVLLVGYFITILLLGFHKSTHTNRKDIIWATIIYTIAYQVFLFVVFCIKIGFLRLPYTYGTEHLFKVVLPMILLIVISELLRYQMISKGKTSKVILVSTIVFFILIDIVVSAYVYDLKTVEGLFKIIIFIVGPSIMKNILFTFYIYYFGYIPSIVCRILMEIPIYYLPIYPDLGEYLTSVVTIIYPAILIFGFWGSIRHKEKQKSIETEDTMIIKRYLKICGNILVAWILLCIICLMSGYFRYAFLAIGSGSMEPNINYGDAIIYEKTDDYKDIDIGEVLVYKYDDRIIVHRVVDKIYSDGMYIFRTKGDNNNAVDAWYIPQQHVIGTVKLRARYLGFPTIFIRNSVFGGE